MTFQPDVVVPKNVRGSDIVAILLTADDAHKLALSDANVGMQVRQALTARLANPPHGIIQQTRHVLREQERSTRWARLYDAMWDDLNPDAKGEMINRDRLP